MTRMFIRHAVSDYEAWRRGYDAFADSQQRLGVTDESVHRDVEDPEMVTVIHDFEDLDRARAFLESEELREAMAEAGVVGEPDIWFTERV